MIRAERDLGIGATRLTAPVFFIQQGSDKGWHVRVTLQMGCFLKGSVRIFRHVAKMGKMNAVRELMGDGGHIIDRVRAKRA